MSERPDTAALLDGIRQFLAGYVILPSAHYYDVVALWVAHAHALKAADTSPRLIFKSPEKESGKTRALEVLEVLTPAPLATINATTAAVFRLLKEEQATLLFDEVDAIFNPKLGKENEDLRALLNAGYRRGATVARVVGEGKKMRVERFPVFAATSLAAIGDLPDTIESRSIIVPMRRRAPDVQVEQFRRRRVEIDALEWRSALEDWASVYGDHLAQAEPRMPDGVTDRAADCWEPLLAIADLAGAEWARRAREAAVLIIKGRVAEDQSIGVRLLAALKTALEGQEKMSSADLLRCLNSLEESPWGGWNDGKGMNPRDLARRLKPFGVESKNIKMPDGTVPKGYLRADFADPWSRYLRDGAATNATSATQIRIQVAEVADVADRWESNGPCPAGGEHVTPRRTGTERIDSEPLICRKCSQEVAAANGSAANGRRATLEREPGAGPKGATGWRLVYPSGNSPGYFATREAAMERAQTYGLEVEEVSA